MEGLQNGIAERGKHNGNGKMSPLPYKKSELRNSKCNSCVQECKGRDFYEQQITFLHQCRSLLSEEVVKWKEESLKLEKDKLKLRKECQENERKVRTISEMKSEAEIKLQSLYDENEKLKMHGIAIAEENEVLLSKLSHSLRKTDSYFLSDPATYFDKSPLGLRSREQAFQFNQDMPSAASYNNTESWEEVSQKLLCQMKQEMEELQELSSKLSSQCPSVGDSKSIATLCRCRNSSLVEDKEVQSNVTEDDNETELDDVRQSVKDLTYQSLLVREKIQDQNAALENIFLQILKSNHFGIIREEKDDAEIRKEDASEGYSKENNISENKKNFSRPSDESFRAYFTRQLKSRQNKLAEQNKSVSEPVIFRERGDDKKNISRNLNFSASEMAKIGSSQINRVSTNQNNHTETSNDDAQSSSSYSDEKFAETIMLHDKQGSSENTEVKVKITPPEEERVCPICEAVFPKEVSQFEFEMHVVGELETETASLLNQYEIL